MRLGWRIPRRIGKILGYLEGFKSLHPLPLRKFNLPPKIGERPLKKEKKEKENKAYTIADELSNWLTKNKVDIGDAIDAMARLIGLAVGVSVDYEEIETILQNIYKESLKAAYFSYKKNQAN